MSGLQCDICGGTVVGHPGGVFRCSNCGVQYDLTWARAKLNPQVSTPRRAVLPEEEELERKRLAEQDFAEFKYQQDMKKIKRLAKIFGVILLLSVVAVVGLLFWKSHAERIESLRITAEDSLEDVLFLAEDGALYDICFAYDAYYPDSYGEQIFTLTFEDGVCRISKLSEDSNKVISVRRAFYDVKVGQLGGEITVVIDDVEYKTEHDEDGTITKIGGAERQ